MKTLLTILASSLLSLSAFADSYSCKVIGNKTDVDSANLNDGESYPDLKTLLGAKSAKIEVNGKKATLQLFDQSGAALALPVYQGMNGTKEKFDNETALQLSSYQTKAYTQRNESAFANDNVTVLDNSYGLHFDLIFKQDELQAGGTLHARLWTAAVGEPDDDSGNQGLFDNSSLFLICR